MAHLYCFFPLSSAQVSFTSVGAQPPGEKNNIFYPLSQHRSLSHLQELNHQKRKATTFILFLSTGLLHICRSSATRREKQQLLSSFSAQVSFTSVEPQPPGEKNNIFYPLSQHRSPSHLQDLNHQKRKATTFILFLSTGLLHICRSSATRREKQQLLSSSQHRPPSHLQELSHQERKATTFILFLSTGLLHICRSSTTRREKQQLLSSFSAQVSFTSVGAQPPGEKSNNFYPISQHRSPSHLQELNHQKRKATTFILFLSTGLLHICRSSTTRREKQQLLSSFSAQVSFTSVGAQPPEEKSNNFYPLSQHRSPSHLQELSHQERKTISFILFLSTGLFHICRSSATRREKQQLLSSFSAQVSFTSVGPQPPGEKNNIFYPLSQHRSPSHLQDLSHQERKTTIFILFLSTGLLHICRSSATRRENNNFCPLSQHRSPSHLQVLNHQKRKTTTFILFLSTGLLHICRRSATRREKQLFSPFLCVVH